MSESKNVDTGKGSHSQSIGDGGRSKFAAVAPKVAGNVIGILPSKPLLGAIGDTVKSRERFPLSSKKESTASLATTAQSKGSTYVGDKRVASDAPQKVAFSIILPGEREEAAKRLRVGEGPVPNTKSSPSTVDKAGDARIAPPAVTLRSAAGQVWEDPTMAEWDPNHFRIFVGDLGPEVTDVQLQQAFSRYASLSKARVVRDRRSNKSKGYGFVSFAEADDFLRAIREMHGKYIGSRPVKLKRSTWVERAANEGPPQVGRPKGKKTK